MRVKYINIAILIVVTIVVTAAYSRAIYDSYTNLELAREQIARGDKIGAIQSYRRSISWFAPGIGYSKTAGDEFLSFIDRDPLTSEEKLSALREMRRGVYGSRSVLDEWTGRSELLKDIDSRIDLLIPPNEKSKPSLDSPPTVNYPSQILALISFFLWTAGAIWAIWGGFSKEGKVNSQVLFRRSVVSVGGFILWLIFLSRA